MKRYIKVVILILCIIFLIPMVSYAKKTENWNELTWDEFWYKFNEAEDDELSDEALQRMINGPTKEERGVSDCITSDHLIGNQARAGELLESRNQASSPQHTGPGTDSSITGKDEEKAKALRKEIMDFISSQEYNSLNMKEEDLKKWINKIDDYKIAAGNEAYYQDSDIVAARGDMNSALIAKTGTGDYSAFEDQAGKTQEDELYQNPDTTDTPTTSVGTIKDMMTDADKFMSERDAEHTNPLGENKESLKSFSKTLSGILLTVGIVIAVIIGGILGIKFMTGAAEEKADVKQLLIPYIVGCIVVFGAITIWSIVVNFGQQFDAMETTEVGTTSSSTSSTSGSESKTSENQGTDKSESKTSGNQGTDKSESKTSGNQGTDKSESKTNENKNTSKSESKTDGNKNTGKNESKENEEKEKTGETSSSTKKDKNSSSTSSSNKDSTSNKKTTVEVKTLLLHNKDIMLDKDHYNSTKLQCDVYPSNATNKKITWESSNKSVATVDSKGNIKAKSMGTTVITAKSENGKKATCKITVIGQMKKVNGQWSISKVKWTREQVESYINNAEELCKTNDFYNYPEAAAGRFPYYTGNPYNGSLKKNYFDKKVGISATNYLILATTMNQRLYIFEKNSAGVWKLIEEEYTSTGRIMNPNNKACWNASNVIGSAHNRFDFYIGAMYGSFYYSHRLRACYEFWQCGKGGNGIEGTGGTYNGTIKEPYYSHRALHSTYNPPTDDARRLGKPTTSRMCSTSFETY